MNELLAPAGNIDCVKTALRYGADAVYLGGPALQLRSDKAGFSMDELFSAVTLAHTLGKKIYVTVNSFAGNREVESAQTYAKEIEAAGVDGAIISDLGVFSAFRQAAEKMELHISTQANCQNYLAARTYYDMGASRVVLGREMTLESIAELRAKTPAGLMLEAFVHGAMCMAFSGRCLISSYLSGRSGNLGECTQPCRWKYALMEEKRPGVFLSIAESDKGTTILSSHDLCCIDILDKLKSAGIESFKIEGRMKTEYYVGTVVNAYRMRMNGTADNEDCLRELEAVSHRPYSQGFYFGQEAIAPYNDGQYRQSCTFVGVVVGGSEGEIQLEQRNNFCVGQTLEALSPGKPAREFVVEYIRAQNGIAQPAAHLVKQIISIPCPFPLLPGDLLRRRDI